VLRIIFFKCKTINKSIYLDNHHSYYNYTVIKGSYLWGWEWGIMYENSWCFCI